MHPKAIIKSSTTFRTRVCPLVYKNVKSEVDKVLVNELPYVLGAGCTTDHWSSRANESYQALTFHFVNADFVLKKFMVECRHVPGRHTGTNIARTLDSMLSRIPGAHESLKFYMTTDAASNMAKGCAESEKLSAHLLCVDHVINNCMNDAMKTPEIEKVIEKVKGLAAKTHRSNHNNEKIKEGCKMTKTAYKKVCLDNLIFYDFHNILD